MTGNLKFLTGIWYVQDAEGINYRLDQRQADVINEYEIYVAGEEVDFTLDEYAKIVPFLYTKKSEGYRSSLDMTSSQTEISDEKAIEMVKDMNKQPMRFHCVPKEISDEEIYSAGLNEANKNGLYNNYYMRGWIEGAKWYREQLKNK